MLQVQRFFLTPKEPVMPGNHGAFNPNLYVVRISLHRGRLAAILAGDGIVIRLEQNRGIPANRGIHLLGDVRRIARHGLQGRLVLVQHYPHLVRTALNLVIQVLSAFCQQLCVQFVQALHPGQRDADVTPNIAHQVLNQSLFVAGSGIAEDRLKAIVGSQLTVIILRRGLRAKAALHRNSGIVEDETPGNAAKVLKRMDYGIQKALQILPFVRYDIGRTTVAQAGAEEVDLLLFTVHDDRGFTPVNLYCVSWRKSQWDENLTDPPCRSHVVHKVAHGRFAACEATFFNEPLVYPACRVSLPLDIDGIVFIQAALHELNHFGRHDCRITVVGFVVPRNVVSFPVFLHRVPRNTQTFRRCALAGHALQLQPTNLLVNIQGCNHLSTPLPIVL